MMDPTLNYLMYGGGFILLLGLTCGCLYSMARRPPLHLPVATTPLL